MSDQLSRIHLETRTSTRIITRTSSRLLTIQICPIVVDTAGLKWSPRSRRTLWSDNRRSSGRRRREGEVPARYNCPFHLSPCSTLLQYRPLKAETFSTADYFLRARGVVKAKRAEKLVKAAAQGTSSLLSIRRREDWMWGEEQTSLNYWDVVWLLRRSQPSSYSPRQEDPAVVQPLCFSFCVFLGHFKETGVLFFLFCFSC